MAESVATHSGPGFNGKSIQTVNPPGTGVGTITREWWIDIPGEAVSDLTGIPDYPDNPTGTDEPATFQAPGGLTDNFGTRMHGYVHPPATGDYTFWLSSDNQGELWLSTSDDTAATVLLATVLDWSAPGQYDKYSEQTSVVIALTAGQKYYVRALQKEGDGGQGLEVAWQGPTITQQIIDGAYLSPYTGEPVVAPTVDTDPTDQTITEGATATFSVTASGSSPVYQWQKDGADIAGANGAAYTTPVIVPGDDNTTYRVIVSNSGGADTSTSTTLTVNLSPPVVTTEPADVSVIEGDTASFSVVVTGSSLTYQWQKDGADIAGATSASYTTPVLTLADSNTQYRVIITNSMGSDTSAAAVLSVSMLIIAPQITGEPQDLSVTVGDTATFTVVATGTLVMYQWNKNETPIEGATEATYIIPEASMSDSGTYTVDVINDSGSVTSATATLTVTVVPPAITEHPDSLEVTEGDSAVFTVTATGTALEYSWKKNGIFVPGANSATLVIESAALTDDGASFVGVVTNEGGSSSSNPAILTVVPEEVSVKPVMGLPASLGVHAQNQFAGPTSFTVSVPRGSRVRLELINPKTGAVTIVVNKYLAAGYYRLQYPGTLNHQGIFVYRIIAGGEVKTGKLFVTATP